MSIVCQFLMVLTILKGTLLARWKVALLMLGKFGLTGKLSMFPITGIICRLAVP